MSGICHGERGNIIFFKKKETDEKSLDVELMGAVLLRISYFPVESSLSWERTRYCRYCKNVRGPFLK